MKLTKILAFLLTCITVSVSSLFATDLIVFHAGSLSVPFKDLGAEFEKRNPDVKVCLESAGSLVCARKITELKRPCDVLAVADYAVIDKIMMPDYADWNIKFATNEMIIMMTEESKQNDKINTKNWMEILAQPGIQYGHSDPNMDPCGYRALQTWQLAEKHYNKPGLNAQLLAGCPPKNIRPKEVDMLAMLETGALDYLFIYKSVALQHHKPFVALPKQINLGDEDFTDFYHQASVTVTGTKPGETLTQVGEPMLYGITVPKNAPNTDLAIKFVQFIISKDGQKIIHNNFQEPIVPAACKQAAKLPPALKGLVKK